MASFLETIKVLVELDSSKASGAFKGLQGDVAKVDQSFQKVKTSGGGIFDAIKANAGIALAGAGTAVAAFAVKAASQFETLALEVDNFTQKTGTSADAASRWVEVGKDLGVSADTIATAFGKMERADAAGTLNSYGLSATDASGRFAELLGKIGSIPDENERAAAAFKVFGRSWQEIAPLLDTTEKLGERLKDVPKGKIISDEQIRSAREFRDNMDDLRDAIEGVVDVIGSKLVAAANQLVNAVKSVGGPISDLIGMADDLGNSLDDATGGFLSSLTDIGGSILNEWLNPMTQLQHVGDALGATVDAVSTGFGLWGDSSDDAAKKTDTLTAAAFRAADGFDAGVSATNSWRVATEAAQNAAAAHAQALKDEAKSLQDMAKIQNDQIDAQRAAGDAYVAVGKATDDYNTFLADLNKTTADAKGNQEKLNEINRDAVDKTAALADAQVTLAAKEAESNAQTQTATQKFDIWGHSIIDSAAKLSGPMQGALLNYLAKVNDIPPDKLTEIQALIAEGKLDEAKAALDEASQARQAAIIADAQTAAAERDLNYTARDRESKVTVRIVGGQYQAVARGGPVKRAAEGGYASATVLVGEEGPELVTLPVGSYVFTASQTRRMTALRAMAAGGPVGQIPYASDVQTGAYGAPRYGAGDRLSGWRGTNAPNVLPSGQYNFRDAEGNTMWTVPVKGGTPDAPGGPPQRGTTIINVYLAPNSDGRDVVDALQQYQRRNGYIPIKVTRDLKASA